MFTLSTRFFTLLHDITRFSTQQSADKMSAKPHFLLVFAHFYGLMRAFVHVSMPT